ncbi:family 3 adenylate cyclase [Leptolyngbyaceae cyanobacterium JSC-12]|nr:family 3 adenylate cyclase [Leptolyngbyaceae cyanobacterium JSC-12]
MNLAASSSRKRSQLPILRSVLNFVVHLLNRRTILLLAILFIAGLAAALFNMSRLSSDLIQSQAVQSSALYAQAIKEARTLYSNNAVSRARQIEGIRVTHDYIAQPGAIPLPATYLIELSKSISQQNPGMSVRLFSDLPFPWRKEEGGPRDDFETAAIAFLRQNPKQPFVRVENFQGRRSLRYAEADIMKPSCVECHNTHPSSPKKDWKVGDVRGVLEITRPLDSFIAQTRAGLQGTFMMLSSLLLLALIGIALVITKLRQNSRELELRVIERTSQLSKANEQLTVEQEKSEQLLLNILPEPIAEQLKEGHSSIAEGFAEATVLFADLVNFTKLSEKIPPTQLISLLNEIFSRFDRLTEKHGLEKIKTIGDAYMVVGGLPNPRVDHAEAIAEMALDMLGEITMFSLEQGYDCDIRIGINSGPVIAGVIGTKKFIYDLWGDTVNVASRMESHGIPGEIQVTAATYERLKHCYTFQARGTIQVKGKGEMAAYLLTGRKRAQQKVVALPTRV